MKLKFSKGKEFAFLSKHYDVWESDSIHRFHKMSPASLNKINPTNCMLFWFNP